MNNLHNDAPDHWFGQASAPNFSRRVAQAEESVRMAKEHLREALQHAYPRGREVNVVHYRGAFQGVVVGWDPSGARVMVQNSRTLKVSKWWAAHVELTQ